MSQKKNKALRKGKGQVVKETMAQRKKLKLIFFASLFSMTLLLVSCMLGRSISHSGDVKLHVEDFEVTFQKGTSRYEYSDFQLEKSKEIFVKVLNDLPVEGVRANLIPLITSGKLNIKYSHHGLLNTSGSENELCFNPVRFLENQNNEGYLESYVIHEDHHLQDWLGNNADGLKYKPCELSGYQSHECILEWWDAEWRAVKEQAEFLHKYNYVGQMTTGPKVNNRAIFQQYDSDHAALEFLRENYYNDPDRSEKYRSVFKEFYRLKMSELKS